MHSDCKLLRWFFPTYFNFSNFTTKKCQKSWVWFTLGKGSLKQRKKERLKILSFVSFFFFSYRFVDHLEYLLKSFTVVFGPFGMVSWTFFANFWHTFCETLVKKYISLSFAKGVGGFLAQTRICLWTFPLY